MVQQWFKNCQKWSKMVQTDPKMGKKCPKWSINVQNGPKMSENGLKMVQQVPKNGSEMVQYGPKMV